jgi:hypothetical protein
MAIQHAIAGVARGSGGRSRRPGWRKPGQPSAGRYTDRTLAALVNELAAGPGPDAVLVLDDYHLVDSGAVHESVGWLVENLPPGVGLVVASRADPPLRLARWRRGGSWRNGRRAASHQAILDEGEGAFFEVVVGGVGDVAQRSLPGEHG